MQAIATSPFDAPPAARWRRVPIAVAGLGALAAVAWFGLAHRSASDAVPSYTLAAAARADIVSQVTASGTLSPVVQVQVGSQVSGRIKALYVNYNDVVEAGQVIATLDPQLFDLAVEQAKARLAAARADLARAEAQAANARLQYDRLAGLATSGAIARSQVDAALTEQRSATAQVVAARAAVTQARSALEQAEVNLAYTTIASPIDGVVVSRSVDVGQTVAASLSAPTLFVIAEDLRKMELHTSVAESDVGQIVADMKVSFTVDAFPDRAFSGAVKQVHYEAQTVSNVVTYDAVVSVDNPDLALRPGMTANVSFIAAERRDVLAVPSRALRYRPAGAGRPERPAGAARAARVSGEAGSASGSGAAPRSRPQAVWVLRNGAPERVRVVTGLSDGTNTEITAGELGEGDPLIVGDTGAAAAPTAAAQARPSSATRGRRGPPPIL